MSKISGSTGRKSADKKFEGYSNLQGAHDQQQKKIAGKAASEANKGLENELIYTLQRQITCFEH